MSFIDESGTEMQAMSSPCDDSPFSGQGTEALASDLSPVDGGREAWMFVVCGFVMETVIWGFGFSYGVFQNYYTSSPSSPFLQASPTAISAIGTTSLAIQMMGMMFLIPIFQRYAHRLKLILWSALVVWCACLVASSFVSEVWQLILLQGVLFGVAGGVLYLPIILWLPEWFVERRGLASGLVFSGTGVGGTVFPLILGVTLQNIGFRWTLRIWACAMTLLVSFAVRHLKPRIPVHASREARLAPLDLSFWKNPVFAMLSATILVQSLGYFPVSLYLPTYTSAVGLPDLDGQLVLSIFNLFLVVGQIAFGYLCDRVPYAYVMISTAMGSALSTYLLWGFAHSLGMVFAFVILFGSLSGGFTSTIQLAAADIAGTNPATIGLVMSSFMVVVGLSAVTGPIVAGSLYAPGEVRTTSSYGGYGFGKVTLFVGTMMIASAAGGIFSAITSHTRRSHR